MKYTKQQLETETNSGTVSGRTQRLVSSIFFRLDDRNNWKMIKSGWDSVTFPTSAHALIYLDAMEKEETQKNATTEYFHQILGWGNQHMLDLYYSS